jgi:hypothetical protein
MIDGGPLRTSRPTGRQVEYQDEPARYQPEEPQRIESSAPHEQTRRAQSYRQAEAQQVEPVAAAPKTPRNFSWVKWAVVLLVITGIAAAGWYFWPNNRGVEMTIDPEKYQAVFLSNGQVYFGRLEVVNSDYMKLTNVYYLERQLTTDGENPETPPEDAEETPSGDNNFQLLKYSDVLYGSEDAMVISQDDIIRYENLRSDGVVAKAIANRS